MPERLFGHVPGYPEGSRFESRAELSKAGVHRPTVAGISGSEREGADSIVLSGGYEDDQDLGDEIVYTGHGGRDPGGGRQIADQNFTRGNRALAYSSLNGLPVRVVRGAGHNSPYPPARATATTGSISLTTTGTSPVDPAFESGATGSSSCRSSQARVGRRRRARRAPPPPRGKRRPCCAS
jgi:hypothetical protein